MGNFKTNKKTRMVCYKDSVLFLAMTILLLEPDMCCSQAPLEHGQRIKSATFRTPAFSVEPGTVHYKNYYNIEFPGGHIGLKSVNGEIVDDAGNSVPLTEAYLHHWLVSRYLQHQDPEDNGVKLTRPASHILAANSGPCQGEVLREFFGLGSETHRTDQFVPDPYAIETGNPNKIPAGYEEKWKINLHLIDTRGVENKLGCTECQCASYNLTVDEFGQTIPRDYIGGSRCCYNQTRCLLREGFEAAARNLYLRYTVKWVDWDSSVLPVQVFILDVTDTGKRSLQIFNGETVVGPEQGCQVEYEIKPCNNPGLGGNECIDQRRNSVSLPTGGYVVFAVCHQHAGGIGSNIYKQDGSVICNSVPIYGQGDEAGDESGYLVEMTSCYPKPGSIEVLDGEKLILESKYSRSKLHTGVMGVFYIMVADQLPDHQFFSHGRRNVSTYVLGTVALLGPAVLLIGIGLKSCKKRSAEDGYEPIRT